MENIHSIPGIGWKTLFVLLTEIIDINRFPVFDRLKSWAAITHDPELFAAHLKYTKRMKGQDSIIRIAKKLLKRAFGSTLQVGYDKGSAGR